MSWKTILFKNKERAINFILKNQNKNGFRYEHKFDGEFHIVSYKLYY